MILGIDANRAIRAQRTGTEGYSLEIIRAILPLALAAGHAVRLYTPAPLLALEPLPPGAEAVVIPFRRLWTHLRLAWELSRRPPDVFFTPAHVIPLTYRGPSVATIHDLGFEHFPRAHTRSQLAYLRWSTRHNVRRGRRLLADSQATRHDLLHRYRAAAARIDVVYPGVDPAMRRVSDPARLAAVRARLNLQGPFLLHLGTIQPRKNLARLVRAFGRSGLTHSLVLAGRRGWLAEETTAAVERQPEEVRSRILLSGFVADEDKAALISAGDALVFPSLYEGFGFPVLEANACGTPVLCADGSSLPEVAGEAALLVDPLDEAALAAGMVRIVSDAALREHLVATGYRNVARFDWSTAGAQALASLERAALSR
jgi:glycosyltransferase involved in cell wall biosynthesis